MQRLVFTALIFISVLVVGTMSVLAAEKAIIHGTAEVSIDFAGRVVVVVDESKGKIAPDGYVDHVFLYSPLEPLRQEFAHVAERATIVFDGEHLTLTTPDESMLVELAISQNQRDASDPPNTVRVLEGIEMIHKVEDGTTPMMKFELGTRFSNVYDHSDFEKDIVDPEECDAGGPGSSSCSCGSGSCSVTCRSGYHACCQCGGGGETSCHCTKN